MQAEIKTFIMRVWGAGARLKNSVSERTKPEVKALVIPVIFVHNLIEDLQKQITLFDLVLPEPTTAGSGQGFDVPGVWHRLK